MSHAEARFRASGAPIVQAYGAQNVATGLRSSERGDGPTELRLWQRVYGAQIEALAFGAQIVSTGLQSSVCSDRGAGLQSSDCVDGPTELSVLRSRRGLTELRLCRRAYRAQCAQIEVRTYRAQIVSTGLQSSVCSD